MTEKQIIAWITENWPSLTVSVILFKAYLNLKQWTDELQNMKKEIVRLKVKMATICRLHTEQHPNDALKIWAEEPEETGK